MTEKVHSAAPQADALRGSNADAAPVGGAVRSPDTRYPYTYACDYLRTKVGAHISRSEMSQIRSLIADALGLDDRYVAEMLANHHHQLSGADFDACAEAVLARCGWRGE